MKYITEESENSSLKLLFRINSTTSNLLKYTNNNNNYDDNNNFYNMQESAIYQLICPNCNKRYIGHHNIYIFLKILKTLINCLNMGMTSPRFVNILSKNGHSIGPTDKIMGTLHITKKGRHVERLGESYMGGGD